MRSSKEGTDSDYRNSSSKVGTDSDNRNSTLVTAPPAFAMAWWDLSGQQHSPRRGKGATRMVGGLAPLHNECARRLGAKHHDAGPQPDAAQHPGSKAFTS
jgi:hypothetical protein